MLQELSNDIEKLVEGMKDVLVTVGAGKAEPRTGLVVGSGEVLTVAMAADVGETVPVHVGEREIEARVTGFDASSGLTLLEAKELTTAAPSATALPAVGQLTVTLAAPIPGDHEARLSMIRCVGGETRLRGGRRIRSYVQTDSARFRGFNASVVVNHAGEVVGMTMPVHRREEPFVMPIAEAMRIVEEMRSGESVGTGYLGVQTTPVSLPVAADGAEKGLLITGVEDESPAKRAGLSVGTFVVKVGDRMTPTVEDLYDSLVGLRAGEQLAVTTVTSEGESHTLHVEVVLRS